MSPFAQRAVSRKRLFVVLSVLGVVVGLGLALFTGLQRLADPDYEIGLRSVVVLLVLLNARQNLRQYRYACELERLGTSETPALEDRTAQE